MTIRAIFFVESPFSERDWSRFGIDFFSTVFDITVADLTPLVDRSFWNEKGDTQMLDPRITSISSTTDLDRLLTEFNPQVFLLNLGVHRYRHHLYRWAQRSGALTVEFQLGAMPGDNVSISAMARLRMALRDPRTIFRALISRNARFRYRHDEPNLFFRGGDAAVSRSRLASSRVVGTHGLDYDLYRSTIPANQTNQSYAVYLDQDMGFHSDYEKNGVTSPVDPAYFYPKLNQFFQQFTASTGLRILVAPHPRSNINTLRGRFTAAEVVASSTPDLVAESSAVLTHASTAVSFAVIARKPVIVIGSTEMLQSWFGRFVRSYESTLGKRCINIDNDTVTEVDLSVDQHRYSDYIQSFLSSCPEDPRRIWQIVADEIKTEISARP